MNRPNLAQLRRELRHMVDRARAALARQTAGRAVALSGAVLSGLLVTLVAMVVLTDRGPSTQQPAGPSTQLQAGPAPTGPAATSPAAPSPSTPTPQPCQPAARIHEVKHGDTLAVIAVRHGSAIERIATDNRITAPDRIRVGTRLNVRPLCAGQTVIQPGTTLSSLASRHRTTVARLAALNPQITDVDHIVAGGHLVLDPATSS